jgi:hypothetical protein
MHRQTSLLGAMAFSVGAIAASTAGAAEAKNNNINTYKDWTGSIVTPFGCPDTTTYGEVITIPSGVHHLEKFSFWMAGQASGNQMVVRGEVYAWDGTKATGSALYESEPRTIAYADTDFHKETFKSPVLKVKPGSKYIVFASTAKDFEQCTNNYQVSWASTDDTAYAGGSFAFQNNAGDENQWTTSPWSVIGIDAAMKATLSK